MLVTYTRLDGSIVEFTNDCTLTSNVLIGKTASFTSSTIVEAMREEATSYFTHDNVTYYYKDITEEIKDYGFSVWARERLTPEEYDNFRSNVAVWNSALDTDYNLPLASTDVWFIHWWQRFEQDLNVSMSP